ncbi:MAG: hypothetical protein ACR2P2_04075 [Nakamurella sp.]
MSSGRNETGSRKALFDDPKSSVRGSLWIGRRKCWLALTAQQSLIGAVVLQPRPDKPMQVYAYGSERSWRGTPTPRHFYDLRRWSWSISEIFAEGVFPDGVAIQLIDPFTRHTVAESPNADQSTTPRFATKTVTLDEAVALLGSVKSAYAGYELDARKLLAYPALIDPQDSISATWYEAFGQACALEPEDPKRCPPDHADRFVTAVLVAEKAWEAAEANARAVALDHLDAEQRNRLRRARRALDLALDPATPAGEREAALATTLHLIQGIVVLPPATSTSLQQAIAHGPGRPQLELDDLRPARPGPNQEHG